MPVGRFHGGQNNQAGFLAPFTSPWGQALARGTPQLVADPAPIGTRYHNFGGTVGGTITVAASIKPVVSSQIGYFGDLPQSEQDGVDSPPPWDRE